MNNMDYRVYVEILPHNLTTYNKIYPFEYDTVEPTESINNGDDYMSYINATTQPSCPPISIKVPSREPVPYNKTTQSTVSYNTYYSSDAIIYVVNITIGVVLVFIVIVYFYKWYEKNRKKIGKIQTLKNTTMPFILRNSCVRSERCSPEKLPIPTLLHRAVLVPSSGIATKYTRDIQHTNYNSDF
jgi:hypothetical protein